MPDDLESRKQTLCRTPFFGGLEDQALGRVIGLLTRRQLKQGEVVFREGEFGRSMFIIESGSLVATRAGASGAQVRLVRLNAGDFFGEMALIEVQPRSTTVTAEAAVSLLELTNMDLFRLYQEDVHAYVMVLQNITRELCRRLRRADGRITDMADEMGDEITQIRPAIDPKKLPSLAAKKLPSS